jgi:hypothetical protein
MFNTNKNYGMESSEGNNSYKFWKI